jgi:hypothetical protein
MVDHIWVKGADVHTEIVLDICSRCLLAIWLKWRKKTVIENVCKRVQRCFFYTHSMCLMSIHNDAKMYTWNKKNDSQYASLLTCLSKLNKPQKRIIAPSIVRSFGSCVNISREGIVMLLCTKIKLNVTEQDAATLEFMQGKCRGRAL